MSDTKEGVAQKVKETRFVIFVPLIITVVCAWLDIWFTKSDDFLEILKTVYTYVFPSLASIMITLIAQHSVYGNDFCGIAVERVGLSTLLLVVYSVAYLSCLSRYNIYTSLVFLGFSLAYIFMTWFFCLDRKLTHIKEDLNMKEEKALERVIDEKK